MQTDGSGNVLASYSYSYDAAGQLSSETDNGVTTNYAYNATGELIQAGSTTYSLRRQRQPDPDRHVIGPDNELLSDGTWNYTYDAAGNQIGKVNIATGETWTYAYNNANQLVSAVDASSSGHRAATGNEHLRCLRQPHRRDRDHRRQHDDHGDELRSERHALCRPEQQRDHHDAVHQQPDRARTTGWPA